MQDKATVTRKRANWAHFYFEDHRIHPLEKKYGKYLYVPLDIPMIKFTDNEKFVSYFFENAKLSTKLRSDASASITGISNYLTIDGLPTTDSSVWSKNCIPSFRSEFKELFDQIAEYFPVNSLNNFSIWSSTADTPSHQDDSLILDLPVSFRIMLHNPNDTSTLTITHQNNTQELVIPIDTNSFAWNNLRMTHGSTFQKPKILFILGDPMLIDWIKYDQLIEKSISKYKKYIIEDQITTIGDFIELDSRDC
jgi:hypothetical protein